MNKKFTDITVKSLLFLAVIILFVLHFDNDQRLVYVDSQKLVSKYQGMLSAKQELESRAAVWKANLDTLRSEVEVKVKEYESTGSKLSAREKKLLEELIEMKQQAYMSYDQVVRENIQKADQELSKQILEKVNVYLEKFGKQKGYKIILAATQYGNIVYADNTYDVTDEVITGLNSEYTNR